MNGIIDKSGSPKSECQIKTLNNSSRIFCDASSARRFVIQIAI